MPIGGIAYADGAKPREVLISREQMNSGSIKEKPREERIPREQINGGSIDEEPYDELIQREQENDYSTGAKLRTFIKRWIGIEE